MQSKEASPQRLEEHPTALALRGRGARPEATRLSHEEVRALALAAGADDAGVVSIDHPALAEERPHAQGALAGVRSLIVIALRMHRDDVQSPRRSVANLEFHRAGQGVDEVAHRIAVALSERGHRAINPSMAFPMEMDNFPGRTWVISQKRAAEAAQLGRMGLHRSVIHPVFGSFILLGTILTTAEVEGQAAPLSFDPCVSCKLCVAACPVGAIEPDGSFRFSACYDHNYHEFMTGFSDFVEEIADSKNRQDLRERMSLPEISSMWQSLAYKPNYKAAYCIAVCPAGEDVLGPFLRDRAAHLKEVVKPLTERPEPIYAVAGSDAEAHVKRRFPHKRVRIVRSSLRPTSPQAFFGGLALTFQRGPARGWRATFHFALSGAQPIQATVRINDGALEVEHQLVGTPDLIITTDGALWIDIVTKRRSPVFAVMTGKLKLQGDRSLLKRFEACFPR